MVEVRDTGAEGVGTMSMQETPTRFTVTGANRDTGEEVRVSIDANSQRAAEAKANGIGILVASVERDDAIEHQATTGRPRCQLCNGAYLTKERYHVLGLPAAIAGVVVAALAGIAFPIFAIIFVVLLLRNNPEVDAMQDVSKFGGYAASSFVMFAIGYALMLSRRVLRCKACDAAYPAR